MNVNGKELAVEIDGPQDAAAVLLVHGLGGTSNFYQVQADPATAMSRKAPLAAAAARTTASPRSTAPARPASGSPASPPTTPGRQ